MKEYKGMLRTTSGRMDKSMFLTRKSDSHNSDHFWLSLVRTGSIFAIITFAWVVILAGLLGITLIQRPLWWITVPMWGFLLIFTAAIQILYLWYMRSVPLWAPGLKSRLVQIPEQAKSLQEDDVWNVLKELSSLRVSQIATAFELPFQRIGVHTEDYRQEIEEAINALYSRDTDQQAFALCLHRLLQVAQQNWTDLAAFSPREREILELLLQNISYKEMGSRLHVSISTIKTHVYHVFQKLDTSNREEAIRLIRERGWFFIHERDCTNQNKRHPSDHNA
jgi:DNA-binding CsgD family transcriptional regulator